MPRVSSPRMRWLPFFGRLVMVVSVGPPAFPIWSLYGNCSLCSALEWMVWGARVVHPRVCVGCLLYSRSEVNGFGRPHTINRNKVTWYQVET